jgi:glucokinase
MKTQVTIAADLGGTNLRTAVVDSDGAILYRTRRETPPGDNLDAIIRAITESISECRKSAEQFQIKAISAAVPGSVNVKFGTILSAPNLPALNNFRFSAALQSVLGIKVILENDANAAAMGENWLGASKGFADSIMVTLGTGVGGGIIINNRLVRGAGGAAGEIGHICVEPFGAPCNCGSLGCLEQYASATALVRLAEVLKPNYPQSKFNHESLLTARDLYQAAADENDELALEVFRLMGFYLGLALSDLINILNPEIIVIGGGASASSHLFMPHLQKTIRERSFSKDEQSSQIALALLGDDAGLIGAAKLAFDCLTESKFSQSVD